MKTYRGEFSSFFGQYPSIPLLSGTWHINSVLRYFIASLEDLPRCFRKRPELASTCKELIKMADNLILLNDDDLSLAEQCKHMYPLRCWLIWFPDSFVALTQGDESLLLILAYFYSLTLAIAPRFPLVNSILFIKMRVESILSIQKRIGQFCSSCPDQHTMKRHMAFPSYVATLLSSCCL